MEADLYRAARRYAAVCDKIKEAEEQGIRNTFEEEDELTGALADLRRELVHELSEGIESLIKEGIREHNRDEHGRRDDQ